jgi:PAS domain S-box-containing protein
MERRKYHRKGMQGLVKGLNTYAKTLHDASFLFEEKVEELSLLRRMGDIVGYIFDQEVFYRKFIDILLGETNAENCSFMLMDGDTNRLVLKMARGRNDDGTFFEHPKDSGVVFSLGEGVAGRTALTREIILINETSKDERFETREQCFSIGSLLCVPLIFQEKIFGVINLSHRKTYAFSENNKRVMQLLCAFVSMLIANAISYIRVRDQEKFKAMFEGVNFSILLLNPETMKIVYCNRYTEESLGYSREELTRMEHIFDIVPQRHREEAKHLLSETIKKNSLEFYELSFMKKDGSVIVGEISGTVISYQEKSVIQLIVKDITEKKETEEKLLQTKKLKSLGELAGGVAHDFNNVLATIIGRTQLLRKSFNAPPGKEERRRSILDLKRSLEIIEKAAFDGAETVRRIQEFSRRRDNDEDFTPVDLNELIDRVVKFTRPKLKNETELKGIKIKIQKRIAPLPPVAGNASELMEVLTSLLINAIEAMPQGGHLTIKTFKEDNSVIITVKDTGVGIPQGMREKIFDPFFTTKGPQSSGLGLSVSYGIINRHRGTILVDSTEGKGTTFTIRLPISKVEIKEKKVEYTPATKRRGRILVIDDEEGIRGILNEILTDAGHEVVIAHDGIKGIKLLGYPLDSSKLNI